MPNVEFVKAAQGDCHDLVDFLDYVFSHAYHPSNFERDLPAQYTPRNIMTGTNYMAREDGKIVANVGAYPADYQVCGDTLRVCGISAVSVHPRARSKGYMRELMDRALRDMRETGTHFSFLLGQRQRYEYFGYTPCGTLLTFSCNKTNIRHYYKEGYGTDITLRELDAGDGPALDAVFCMHGAGSAFMRRPRERLADIMATWQSKTVVIYLKDEIIGYLSASSDYDTIYEPHISDPGLLGGVIGTYLNQYDRHEVSVEVYPHEAALVTQLLKFAESAAAGNALHINVLDYPGVLTPFMKLKCATGTVPDGELTVAVKGMGSLTLSVDGNRPTAAFTNKSPHTECTHTEAMQLLFSPVSAYSLGALEGNAFARCLLPVPLFVRKADQS
jgi:GNAT superfamily N-acetyltransferase